MPFVNFWKLSYWTVLQLSAEVFSMDSTKTMHSLSVLFSMNLLLNYCRSKYWKQGRSEPSLMISTRYTMSLTYFLSSKNPLQIKVLKYSNISQSLPPISSKYSLVSLKGAFSKLIPPGEVPNKNPKSMWMI